MDAFAVLTQLYHASRLVRIAALDKHMAHPSLTAPSLRIEPLSPKQVMGRNEPCWCGSKIKWKNCHKDRETQQPTHVMQSLEALRESLMRGRCVHPDAGNSCTGEAISAHTVQRNGGLTAIAENGHVLSVKRAAEKLYLNSGKFVLEKVGVRRASTFNGFCSHHDATMFRPVEMGVRSLNAETCFLLSFRALAYELIIKEAAIASIPLQRDLDKGRPFHEQVRIQEQLHISNLGFQLGLADLVRFKEGYDKLYRSHAFSEFHCVGVVFDKVLPVVASGAFHPEIDFDGKPLQKLGVGPANHESAAFNLTVLDGVSVAVVGWLGVADGPCADFSASLVQAIKIDGGDAAIRLAFEHLENTYIRPSWWDTLSPQQRLEAIERMRAGLPSSERTAGGLTRRQTFVRGVNAVRYFKSGH
jgi:hypothetical protein